MEYVKNIEKAKAWGGMDKKILMILGRSLGIGILLAFLTFLFGDSPAIALVFLVIYMEIRFGRE